MVGGDFIEQFEVTSFLNERSSHSVDPRLHAPQVEGDMMSFNNYVLCVATAMQHN